MELFICPTSIQAYICHLRAVGGPELLRNLLGYTVARADLTGLVQPLRKLSKDHKAKLIITGYSGLNIHKEDGTKPRNIPSILSRGTYIRVLRSRGSAGKEREGCRRGEIARQEKDQRRRRKDYSDPRIVQEMNRVEALVVATLTGATVSIIQNREGEAEKAAEELAKTLQSLIR